MKLFVLGGTGHVGRHVLAQSSAHEVTALVRAQSRALVPASLAHVRVVEGDALDASALNAMAGSDAVVSSIGIQRKSNANPWSALTTPADLCSRSAALIGNPSRTTTGLDASLVRRVGRTHNQSRSLAR